MYTRTNATNGHTYSLRSCGTTNTTLDKRDELIIFIRHTKGGKNYKHDFNRLSVSNNISLYVYSKCSKFFQVTHISYMTILGHDVTVNKHTYYDH